MKWGLGEEDKEYGTAGKLDIPTFGDGEHESNLRNVGKLKLPSNLEVRIFCHHRKPFALSILLMTLKH